MIQKTKQNMRRRYGSHDNCIPFNANHWFPDTIDSTMIQTMYIYLSCLCWKRSKRKTDIKSKELLFWLVKTKDIGSVLPMWRWNIKWITFLWLWQAKTTTVMLITKPNKSVQQCNILISCAVRRTVLPGSLWSILYSIHGIAALWNN